MNPNLGTIAGLLISLPFVALADWFGWINKQRHPELAKACHGIGMLSLVAYAISCLGGPVDFIAQFVGNPGNFFWTVPAGMAAWGLGWFLLNARYAAQTIGQPHRATMIVRALLKIAVGTALWAYVGTLGRSGGWSDVAALLLHIAAVWCLSTGLTKLGLMLWGRRHGQAEQLVAGDIERQQFSWDDDRSIR
jgi:hypothetical protein